MYVGGWRGICNCQKKSSPEVMERALLQHLPDVASRQRRELQNAMRYRIKVSKRSSVGDSHRDMASVLPRYTANSPVCDDRNGCAARVRTCAHSSCKCLCMCAHLRPREVDACPPLPMGKGTGAPRGRHKSTSAGVFSHCVSHGTAMSSGASPSALYSNSWKNTLKRTQVGA